MNVETLNDTSTEETAATPPAWDRITRIGWVQAASTATSLKEANDRVERLSQELRDARAALQDIQASVAVRLSARLKQLPGVHKAWRVGKHLALAAVHGLPAKLIGKLPR